VAELAYAAALKAAAFGYEGSTPSGRTHLTSPDGGIGIHSSLKSCRRKRLAGSSPAQGTRDAHKRQKER
jgi:hypothetical protein